VFLLVGCRQQRTAEPVSAVCAFCLANPAELAVSKLTLLCPGFHVQAKKAFSRVCSCVAEPPLRHAVRIPGANMSGFVCLSERTLLQSSSAPTCRLFLGSCSRCTAPLPGFGCVHLGWTDGNVATLFFASLL
jgi:hypothetical protein